MNIEASNKEIICYCFGHSVQDLRNDVLTEIRDYFRLNLGKWAIFKNAG